MRRTPLTASPHSAEMLSGKKYTGNEVDIWSMGVVLFLLVTGRLPFDDSNMSRLFHAVYSGHLKLPEGLSPGTESGSRWAGKGGRTKDPVGRGVLTGTKKKRPRMQGHHPGHASASTARPAQSRANT
ncbi:MAG: hypothetical protein BJ554DRAFT_5492 [Olpidium bornovanus]|uniref:Protein kinase domain-containing protein n=1 Tax=Olpidium bornovanus TaxID=278681 RepID=A0A8H7ZZG4_9FUNG|nr:MAG: hypothetical protein BJ554DRAFT_5492 [Olpidium bornovanus]